MDFTKSNIVAAIERVTVTNLSERLLDMAQVKARIDGRPWCLTWPRMYQMIQDVWPVGDAYLAVGGRWINARIAT